MLRGGADRRRDDTGGGPHGAAAMLACLACRDGPAAYDEHRHACQSAGQAVSDSLRFAPIDAFRWG